MAAPKAKSAAASISTETTPSSRLAAINAPVPRNGASVVQEVPVWTGIPFSAIRRATAAIRDGEATENRLAGRYACMRVCMRMCACALT